MPGEEPGRAASASFQCTSPRDRNGAHSGPHAAFNLGRWLRLSRYQHAGPVGVGTETAMDRPPAVAPQGSLCRRGGHGQRSAHAGPAAWMTDGARLFTRSWPSPWVIPTHSFRASGTVRPAPSTASSKVMGEVQGQHQLESTPAKHAWQHCTTSQLPALSHGTARLSPQPRLHHPPGSVTLVAQEQGQLRSTTRASSSSRPPLPLPLPLPSSASFLSSVSLLKPAPYRSALLPPAGPSTVSGTS